MRKTELRRRQWIGQGKPRKALAKVNRERASKRKVRYSTLIKAYRKGETRKIVAARAGGICEYVGPVTGHRCEQTEFLEHHHKRYPKVPGGERPEDMQVLCRTHHQYVESLEHPTRRWRFAS